MIATIKSSRVCFPARSLKSGVYISLRVHLNSREPQCCYLVIGEQGLSAANTIFQAAFPIALTRMAFALIH